MGSLLRSSYRRYSLGPICWLIGTLFGGVWLFAAAARAQNATWTLNPGSTDFNTASNWTPATVPSGTASFGASNTTSITFSTGTFVDTLQFNAGAPAYSFAVSNSFLELSGTGIVNNSSNIPTINNTGPSGTFFVNSSTAGNATITVNEASGGFVEFANSSTAGSATITANGSNSTGAVFFVDTSTAGSAIITTNSGSVLEFNDNSNASNATVITNSGSITAFQNAASGGQARFITNSGGTFDISLLTAAGTTVGSIEGSGNYNLGAKQLTVGSNNLSTVVSGQINDGGLGGGTGGSLVKIGTGTLTLSGSNGYTGLTVINGGTLEVDGTIATTSSVTVNSGATLSGTGTVDPPTVTIMSGGTLAPGNASNPTGTLTVTGNLAFQPGALYAVQVTPATASATAVTGSASLTGGTVNAQFAPGTYLAKQYTILTAAGGLGATSFAGLSNTNLPAGFTDSLSYSGNSAFLDLTAILGTRASGGLNQNQQHVAGALNNFFNAGGALPPSFVNVFGLTGGALANALTQLSGESATGAERAAFQLGDQFLNVMLDPFVTGRGSTGVGVGGSALAFALKEANLPPDVALAYAPLLYTAPPKPIYEPRWTAWGAGYGGTNNASGDATVGSNNVTASTYGGAAGMDYHFTPDTVAGFALAGAGTNWNLVDGLGNGRSDAFQAGAYGMSWFGAAYVAGAFDFSNHWFSTSRSVLTEQLTANFIGQSYGGRLEGGYRWLVLPAIGITPYGAVQAQSFHTPGYNETNQAGGFGLTYAAQDASDVRTELGARFDDPTLFYGRPLILFGRVAWAHDFVNGPALNAAFESLPGASFTVNGAPIPHDSALTSAGARLFLSPNWMIMAKFDGEFAPKSQTYAGTGTLRYVW
jgi:autotransporter-associated beta strand protein